MLGSNWFEQIGEKHSDLLFPRCCSFESPDGTLSPAIAAIELYRNSLRLIFTERFSPRAKRPCGFLLSLLRFLGKSSVTPICRARSPCNLAVRLETLELSAMRHNKTRFGKSSCEIWPQCSPFHLLTTVLRPAVLSLKRTESQSVSSASRWGKLLRLFGSSLLRVDSQ